MRLAQVTLLIICVNLSACGFQLRGSDVMPESVHSVYIAAPIDSRFVKSLHRAMAVRGVTVVGDVSQSNAQIQILRDESGQRILSVAVSEGPEEYEVYQIIAFSFSVEDQSVIDSHSFTLTRDYTYDRDNILGKRQEYESLRLALADEMAEAVIRKIRFSE